MDLSYAHLNTSLRNDIITKLNYFNRDFNASEEQQIS